jgi:hypothetical protein
MEIVSLAAHFDGQSIQLDEPYALKPNTKLIITILPTPSDDRDAWLRLSLSGLNVPIIKTMITP